MGMPISLHLFIWTWVVTSLLLFRPSSCGEENSNKLEEKGNSTRYQLHRYLFHDYNKHVRPSHTRNRPVNVSIAFVLYSILNMNEKEQKITTSSQIIMFWDDWMLQWDPDKFGDINRLTLEQQDVWLPDINIGNSMVTLDQPGYSRSPVSLTHDGVVTWSVNGIFETSCSVDITYFPFDAQTCFIMVASLSSPSEDLVLRAWVPDHPIETLLYMPNSKWELTDTWAEFIHTEGFTVFVRYHLVLKRRPVAVAMNILLPLFFLSTNAALVFALSIDSGERLSMAITIILAYAVYLTILSDTLPESSLRVAALSITILILIFICTLIVGTTIFITGMYRWEGFVGPTTDVLLKTLRRMQRRCKRHKKSTQSDELIAIEDKRDKEFLEVAENAKLNGYGPQAKESHTTTTDDDDANNSRLTYAEGALILDTIFFWFFNITTVLAILGLVIFLTTAPSKPEYIRFSNPLDEDE